MGRRWGSPWDTIPLQVGILLGNHHRGGQEGSHWQWGQGRGSQAPEVITATPLLPVGILLAAGATLRDPWDTILLTVGILPGSGRSVGAGSYFLQG
jgi:hypothetical protein